MNSNSSFSKLNFLSTTQRRFYTKNKPSHEVFTQEPRLSKVIKVLNTSCTMKKINKYQFLKTQIHQNRCSEDFTNNHDSKNFNEIEFIKKQIKAKIDILLKKSDKKWKQLIESYEDMKICTNKETFGIQQNKFYSYLYQIMKKTTENSIDTFAFQGKMTKTKSSQQQNEQKSMKINLQKIKLMKQNEILRKRCLQSSLKVPTNQQNHSQNCSKQQNTLSESAKQMKHVHEFEATYLKMKQEISKLSEKVYQLQNQNVKLKQNLVISEDAVHILREDKIQLTKKVSQLKIQNQNFCSQFVRINLQNENSNIKIQRWRSIIGFQQEEILSYESELNSIKNQYKDLLRKYKIIVKRLNAITANNETAASSNGFGIFRQTQQFNMKYLQTFKEQLQTFNKVRGIFCTKQGQNSLDKSGTLIEKKLSGTSTSQNNYKNYLSEKETFSNSNGIKKLYRQHYAYFKPNFYNLIQSYMDIHGIDSTTMEQFASFDLNIDFLSTVRAIFDCKFNQFLHQDSFRNISSFASFTYAWLTKYKVHRKQKKIISIKGDLDKDVIPTFFMNLMSQRLNSYWQIITFRQFLLDSLTIDQLYFFLMARNYIFSGSLMENVAYVYQQVCYMNIADALNLMQRFIPDVNYRKKIQQYIKRYIIYVRKRALIDIHFMLRILLQYYQAKKHQQFTNLASLSDLLSREKLSSFSFESFLKIFQYNFTYLSLTEKIEIYRKCFSSSRGKISLQVILTVLTQQGYLCYEVKKIFCNDQITIVKNQTKSDDKQLVIEPYLPELIKFDQFFKQFYKESYEQEKSQLGLEKYEKQFEMLCEFDQYNIFERISKSFHFCLSTFKKMFYTKRKFKFISEISLSASLPILSQTVEILKKLNKMTCQKKSIMNLMIQFKRQSAAKKILRFYRKKRNQMHRNFIFGVKDQVFEQDQKMENIRKQFNFMIQNMKQKFQTESKQKRNSFFHN